MPHNKLIHDESVLHWIWRSLQFRLRNLETRSGHSLKIIHPGNLNHSDGPDFLSAKIFINQLEWHGSVELHLYEQDWYNHRHHRDSNYNNVILHVILFANAKKVVRRRDGTSPFTLTLKPYLSSNLLSFIKDFKNKKTIKYLPCSRYSSGILRDDLFLRQLSRAHKSYFYQKVYDQYAYWSAKLPVQIAWRRMIILSLFDGLGISHNRESMVRLAQLLFKQKVLDYSRDDLIQYILQLAGFSHSKNRSAAGKQADIYFNWNTKGVRPPNRPQNRIQQGVYLIKKIINTPMEDINRKSAETIWHEWITEPKIPGLGSRRSNILYSISLVPCLKIAADLAGDFHRVRKIRHAWNTHRVSIPDSYKQVLDKTLINSDIYARCIGTVYQLRHFCFKHRCSDCLVFQKAFSS